MAVERVVTLLASATEIVAALGRLDALVARSHECDWPEEVLRLPACTEPKIDVGAPSRDIDTGIRRLVENGLSVYRVDGAALRALAPDVIVTQTQCEVCAVSERELEAAVADWLEGRPKIVSLSAVALDGIWRDIEGVATALGVHDRGTALVAGLRARVEAIAERTRRLTDRPRVACIEWIDPLMAAGNWVPELVALGGGVDLFGKAGRHSPWMSWEALCAADPDVIVVLPCGFDIARSRAELGTLATKPGWGSLRAVTTGRVCIADGHRFFNRPGPRIVESLEIMAEMLHPACFDFGHAGVGWEPL